WVWGVPLSDLAALIVTAPLVVTFNGGRFDLPFLAEQFPGFPRPNAHIDLAPIARGAGLVGGQKVVEEKLKIRRSAGVRGLTGADAVVQWCEALYGKEASYRRLLEYNQADVSALPEVAEGLARRQAKQYAWMSAA